ncbi:NTE family protein [Nocardia kruczakiae]|uniref:NTE family protein n=1 Tax=Nocardia kruczakiae TaxID=261477 RepID=A0ABU1X8G8_9NOCA|nr:patatin-like phospholipase family protein [Nocardia kruczakiae]MDR7166838.1 NTE family protein [Nocardia kruczakiae]
MCAAPSPDRFRTALVLGGGGPVGIAWMAGVMVGLRSAGLDPARADRIVGTSAGSVVGAVLAAGGDLEHLGATRAPGGESFAPDPRRLAEIFSLRTSGGDAREIRRRMGELALAAEAGDPGDHVERIARLAGVTEWPDADLRVTTIDIGTGELQVWTRDTAATLPQALAASTSVPGVFPPIPIGESRYFDGGVRSALNADLAAGAENVVIMEPLAHMFPRTRADSAHGAATEISLAPDADAVAVFGFDVFNPAALTPAYEAGLRQSADAAKQLANVGFDA